MIGAAGNTIITQKRSDLVIFTGFLAVPSGTSVTFREKLVFRALKCGRLSFILAAHTPFKRLAQHRGGKSDPRTSGSDHLSRGGTRYRERWEQLAGSKVRLKLFPQSHPAPGACCHQECYDNRTYESLKRIGRLRRARSRRCCGRACAARAWAPAASSGVRI